MIIYQQCIYVSAWEATAHNNKLKIYNVAIENTVTSDLTINHILSLEMLSHEWNQLNQTGTFLLNKWQNSQKDKQMNSRHNKVNLLYVGSNYLLKKRLQQIR